MPVFRNIGVIGRVDSDSVIGSIRQLVAMLQGRAEKIVLEEQTANALDNHQMQVATRKLIGEICDLVIVVGGDGRSSVGDLGLERMDNSYRFERVSIQEIGCDVYERYERVRG